MKSTSDHEKIHILFVCGYGIGTSVIMENNVRKALKEKHIEAEMQHAAGGEVASYKNWPHIIGISKKLLSVLDGIEVQAHVIEIVNLMDRKSIADDIECIIK